MVTCLFESPFGDTCYHFALIFAKLLTVSRFSQKERIRKILPLSTIFSLKHENHQFSPFGENWRLGWNQMISNHHKNCDFSRFSQNPATSRGKFTTFAKKPFLTTSSGIKKWPLYCGQKKKEKTLLWRVFLPQKKLIAERYRSKNRHPTELKPPQKSAIFGRFLRPKLRL